MEITFGKYTYSLTTSTSIDQMRRTDPLRAASMQSNNITAIWKATRDGLNFEISQYKSGQFGFVIKVK